MGYVSSPSSLFGSIRCFFQRLESLYFSGLFEVLVDMTSRSPPLQLTGWSSSLCRICVSGAREDVFLKHCIHCDLVLGLRTQFSFDSINIFCFTLVITKGCLMSFILSLECTFPLSSFFFDGGEELTDPASHDQSCCLDVNDLVAFLELRDRPEQHSLL